MALDLCKSLLTQGIGEASVLPVWNLRESPDRVLSPAHFLQILGARNDTENWLLLDTPQFGEGDSFYTLAVLCFQLHSMFLNIRPIFYSTRKDNLL